MEYLNLEANNIGDKAAIEIFKTIKKNIYLKRLNLSKNNLTNMCTWEMAECLKENDTLEELYLHYNKIQGDGAQNIFAALIKNTYLKVLDLSWNSLGASEKGLANAFFELFSKNNELVHCDFSYNNISYETTVKAAEGLKLNHSIYGLHWNGNQGYVDTEGFLIPFKTSLSTDLQPKHSTAISKRRINGVQCLKDGKGHDKAIPTENCWICEGWTENTIYYIPGKDNFLLIEFQGKSGNIFDLPLYIHFDFEQYVGRLLERTDSNTFKITKMIPPGTRKYFFSHNYEPVIARDQPSAVNDFHVIKVSLSLFFYLINQDVKIEKEVFTLNVPRMNYKKLNSDIPVIDKDYNPIPTLKPREEVDIKHEIQEKKWSVQNSIFKDYKAEDEVKRFVIYLKY